VPNSGGRRSSHEQKPKCSSRAFSSSPPSCERPLMPFRLFAEMSTYETTATRIYINTYLCAFCWGFFPCPLSFFFHLSCFLCAHCFYFLFFLFSPLLFFVCFVFSCFFCFVLLFISFFSFKFSVFVSPVSMVVRCRANRYTIRGVCVLRGRAADQNAFARRKPRCFFHFTHQTTFLFYFFIFFCKTGVFYRSSSSLRRKLFSN